MPNNLKTIIACIGLFFISHGLNAAEGGFLAEPGYPSIRLATPDNDPRWQEIARLWPQKGHDGNLQKIIGALETLEKKQPDSFDTEIWLARAYLARAWTSGRIREADFKLAEQHACQAHRLKPDDQTAFHLLALAVGPFGGRDYLLDNYAAWVKAATPMREYRQLRPLTESKKWMEGLKIWNNRSDINQALLAVKIFEEYADARPNDVEAQVWVARAYYYLGEYWLSMGQLEDKGTAYFRRGAEYGEKAVKLAPESLTAHYWYMADLSRSIQASGLLNQARYSPIIIEEIKTCMSEDGLYFFGGPAMILSGCITIGGKISQKAMTMLGATPEMAINLLEIAELCYPDCFYMPYLAADQLILMGQQAKAAGLLKRVSASDPACSPRYAPENECLVRMSKTLLQKLNCK